MLELHKFDAFRCFLLFLLSVLIRLGLIAQPALLEVNARGK